MGQCGTVLCAVVGDGLVRQVCNVLCAKMRKLAHFSTFFKKIFEIPKKKKVPHLGAQNLHTEAHTSAPYIFWPFLALQKVRNSCAQMRKKKKAFAGGTPQIF